MTGDERLLRIERVGDKKNNESNDKSQSDKHKKDDESPKQEFAAVIVDVGNSATVKPNTEESSTETKVSQAKQTASSGEIENSKVSQDNDSNDKNIESQGHIDVTG